MEELTAVRRESGDPDHTILYRDDGGELISCLLLFSLTAHFHQTERTFADVI